MDNIWRADTISRMTSGAMLPDGMTCFPVFDNDEDLEHFQLTLGKPKIAKQGFWATKKGLQMVEKAEKLAKGFKEGHMKKFGLSQGIKTRFNSALQMPEEGGEEEDRKPAAVQSGETVVEPACKNRPELLQTVGRKHLENQLTVKMVKEIASNAGRECRELVNSIETMINTEEKANHWWHILQYAKGDFLTLTKMTEKTSNTQGSMIGKPTNMAGKNGAMQE